MYTTNKSPGLERLYLGTNFDYVPTNYNVSIIGLQLVEDSLLELDRFGVVGVDFYVMTSFPIYNQCVLEVCTGSVTMC